MATDKAIFAAGFRKTKNMQKKISSKDLAIPSIYKIQVNAHHAKTGGIVKKYLVGNTQFPSENFGTTDPSVFHSGDVNNWIIWVQKGLWSLYCIVVLISNLSLILQ